MSAKAKDPTVWLASAKSLADGFASKHKIVLSTPERQVSAAFEIGAFHALLRFYDGQKYALTPRNLIDTTEYRYLTSPSGNPNNFSFVEARGKDGRFEIRQQVRVRSHVDPNITFTPDLLVVAKGAAIISIKDIDYAAGKRSFYSVDSSQVVAAHECKSMNPFPELLVSFLGMFICAHEWHPNHTNVTRSDNAGHLAPTLFVGGTERALHRKMIAALQKQYQLNIVCGLHLGTWNLLKAKNRLLWSAKSISPPPQKDDEEIPF